MEVNNVELTSAWCFSRRDAAFASGNYREGETYQEMGSMWLKRESEKEKDNV